MATINEIYESLKEFRAENTADHNEVFTRLRAVEIRHAKENGFAEAAGTRRGDVPLTHKTRRQELAVIVALAALAGERIVALMSALIPGVVP